MTNYFALLIYQVGVLGTHYYDYGEHNYEEND